MSVGRALVRLVVEDSDGEELSRQDVESDVAIATALVDGKREPVAIPAAGFTALTMPSGARGVIIRLVSGMGDCLLTLKGPTGDTGIVLKLAATTTLPSLPIVVPLASTSVIGIASATGVAAGVVEVTWF